MKAGAEGAKAAAPAARVATIASFMVDYWGVYWCDKGFYVWRGRGGEVVVDSQSTRVWWVGFEVRHRPKNRGKKEKKEFCLYIELFKITYWYFHIYVHRYWS